MFNILLNDQVLNQNPPKTKGKIKCISPKKTALSEIHLRPAVIPTFFRRPLKIAIEMFVPPELFFRTFIRK